MAEQENPDKRCVGCGLAVWDCGESRGKDCFGVCGGTTEPSDPCAVMVKCLSGCCVKDKSNGV